jgi:hypothetical protein
MFTRCLPLAFASLFLATLASAQSFNIDVGPNLSLWPEPSPGYGAAAAQTGVWNAVRNPFAGNTLVTLVGAASGVTLSSNISSSFTYPFGTLGPDDDAFTSDGQAISYFGASAVWTFSGLGDGQYQLYTYCWDPANSGVKSDVSIVGMPSSTQSVGGIWSGSPHVLGVTYAQHNVNVVGGQLAVEVYGNAQNDSATVLGFQLVGGAGSDAFCFGDGTGTSCPCGNLGGPGEGCQNSSGAGATLGVQGSTSVALDDLRLNMSGGPAVSVALLFAGTGQVNGGNGALFGDGLRCAGGQIQRLGVRVTSAGAADWGPGLAPVGGWLAGDTRYFQAWYRDTNNSPCGLNFNLSHGVALTFVP